MTDSDKMLLRLSDYRLLDTSGRPMRDTDILIFWNIINMFRNSDQKLWVVRGDSDVNLSRQFNGVDSRQPELLAQYIFMVGEKGRICWNEKRFLDPEDTSADNFRNNCKLLGKVLASSRKGSEGRSRRMAAFMSENQTFVAQFISGAIDMAVDKYVALPPESRRIVNRYYLAVVHTINPSEFRSRSPFVSLTEDIDVADGFGKDVTIFGWVPKFYQPYYIRHGFATEAVSVLRDAELPYLTQPVYPEQAEVSVLCGILPHFIIGFASGNNFYVNPAVFTTMDLFRQCHCFSDMQQLRKDIIKNGLLVDQDKFEEFCRMTSYKRYFTSNGLQYRIQSIN